MKIPTIVLPLLAGLALAGCSYAPTPQGQAQAEADLVTVAKAKDAAQTVAGFLPPPFDWIVSGVAVAGAGVATVLINRGKKKAEPSAPPA